MYKISRPEVFFVKDVLKKPSKFTWEHPCLSVISIKLLCNFIEITHWHGCSPVNLLHIFRAPFPKNASERLIVKVKWKFRRGPRCHHSFLWKPNSCQCSWGRRNLENLEFFSKSWKILAQEQPNHKHLF